MSRTVNQQIGIIKRQARASAKRLVQEYLETGIHENYGSKELWELESKIPVQLSYTQQVDFSGELRTLIKGTCNILSASGKGNTDDKGTRIRLTRRAMLYIDDYEWI